jgi:parvulin-like peptidyl-prolyl isomerase
MNRQRQRVLFAFATIGALAFVSATGVVAQTPTATDASDDTVLAEFEWNGTKHAITYGQLKQEISELPEYRRDDYKGHDGQLEYLTLMAESRMLLQRANDLELNKNAEINKKIAKYRRQMMLDEIYTKEVDEKVSVSDAEIEKYYADNMSKYLIPEQVRLTSLAMTDRDKVQKALDEIVAGGDLKEIIKGYSEQGLNEGPGGRTEGDTGLFSQDSYPMAQGFVDKAFSMKVGDWTNEIIEQEVRGQTYYMIFRVEERNAPRQQTLDEVRDTVKRSVERDKTDAREKEWYESLKTSATLTLYPERVPNVRTEEEEKKEEQPTENAEGGTTQETTPKEPEPPVVKPETVDANLVLAEYVWNGEPKTYTWHDLWATFSDLAAYRQSRYQGSKGLAELLAEETLDELKVLAAADAGIGSRDADLAKFEEYRHQLMVEELVKREVDNTIQVTDEALQTHYKTHLSDYMEPEKVRLTCLTYTDENEARTALEELRNGRDVKEAAKTLSEMGKNVGPGVGHNGDTGFFDRSTYSHAAAFTEAAFSTPLGELTKEPVKQEMQGTPYWIIFKVDDKQPERQQDFEEVKSRVEDAVERELKRKRLNEWLNGLKEQSQLTVFADRLPMPTEATPTETPEEKPN